jgi:hypothetical protein
MKKIVIMFFIVMSLCCASMAVETVSNGICAPLELFRAEANENSTLIDLTTTGDFTHKPTAAKHIPVVQYTQQTQVKNVVFYFCGGSAANKTFGYKIWAWRNNGMAELVAEGTGTLGTQAIVKYPNNSTTATNKYWADTLTISSGGQGTPETFQVADGSGADRCAKLYGYNCGYEWFYCEITDADGTTGSEAGLVSVYWSYFN